MAKNIVILGAGFGGIRAALTLQRTISGDFSIIVVDRNEYHLYYPRLFTMIVPKASQITNHELKGSAVPLREIFTGTQVEFVRGDVQGLDCKKRVVELDSGKIQYDCLILALGAGTDYFGIAGLEKYACTLKSIEDAGMIREKVMNFLQKIRHPEEPQGDEGSRTNKSGILRAAQNDSNRIEIMIGGAGATGVEVAAELAYLFRNISRGKWSVTLVEALSAVLWMFPKSVGEYAYQRLTKLGVQIMLDTCIKRVELPPRHSERSDEMGVEVVLAPRPLKDGEKEADLACDFLPEHEKRISADLLIWSGGIRANPLISKCALETDRKGRVAVNEYFQVKGFDNIFAIGDNAVLLNPQTGQPIPATAQAAVEQGKLTAENIARVIKSRGSFSGRADGSPFNTALCPYNFHDFPAIILLANRSGVAYMRGRAIYGQLTWILAKARDFLYFTSILGWTRGIKRFF